MKNKFLLLAFGCCLMLAAGCTKSKKEGLTSSGYKFTNHTNNGGYKPQVGDRMHYHVQHRRDGEVKHSSRWSGAEPNFFLMPDFTQLTRRPSPILDVLKEMSEGDSATVKFPLDSLKVKPKGFETADTLYYDVILVKIEKASTLKDAPTPPATADNQKTATFSYTKTEYDEIAGQMNQVLKDYQQGKLSEKIKTTQSGLKYMILNDGSGKLAQSGNKVAVNYHGLLPNGHVFDSSFKRNSPFQFNLGLGRVIKGWDEGIALLTEGTDAVLFIPAALAYGQNGMPQAGIPPNSELIFYVQLIQVLQ